jgi:hypothetical protein
MTAVCAFRPAGVAVQRLLQTATMDVAVVVPAFGKLHCRRRDYKYGPASIAAKISRASPISGNSDVGAKPAIAGARTARASASRQRRDRASPAPVSRAVRSCACLAASRPLRRSGGRPPRARGWRGSGSARFHRAPDAVPLGMRDSRCGRPSPVLRRGWRQRERGSRPQERRFAMVVSPTRHIERRR